jgi:hypothetical protein
MNLNFDARDVMRTFSRIKYIDSYELILNGNSTLDTREKMNKDEITTNRNKITNISIPKGKSTLARTCLS